MADEPQRPTTDDRDAWKTYWAKAQPREWFERWGLWRTEPEIGAERRAFLAGRRAVTPNIEQDIYPFRDAKSSIKLDRADVEWLLATHDSSGFKGPVDWSDVSQRTRHGIDLRGADLRGADLNGLPLARLRGGLTFEEVFDDDTERLDAAAVILSHADLRGAHVENGVLRRVQLDGADLRRASLILASLYNSDLSGARLGHSILAGTNLRRAVFSPASNLYEVVLTTVDVGAPRLRDVQWNGVDLTVVNWGQVYRLGDEDVVLARRYRLKNDAQNMTRANRQLASVLRSQGLSDDADRFAYRAQVLQRRVFRQQRHWLRYVGSLILDVISGHGYRPLRAFLAYAAVILGFMGLYLLNSQFVAPHLTWNEALVLSMSSFHGRGFFNSSISLGDTYAELAAAEAFLGLMIEITFIATFTQRFFAR